MANKKIPMRKCVGCQEMKEKTALRKGDRRTKNSPLVSLEAGRGENQTQQLKLYFFFYSIGSPL